jgi:hypothetical protein
MIRARLVWLALSSVMLADAGVMWSQGGAITGQVMVRENPEGKHSAGVSPRTRTISY